MKYPIMENRVCAGCNMTYSCQVLSPEGHLYSCRPGSIPGGCPFIEEIKKDMPEVIKLLSPERMAEWYNSKMNLIKCQERLEIKRHRRGPKGPRILKNKEQTH